MTPDGPPAPIRALRWIARLPIALYQRFISRWTPPSCRFRPTCSAYADDAIAIHGIVRGGWMAMRRILRCHVFSDTGLDPVPGGRLDDLDEPRLVAGWLRAHDPRETTESDRSAPDGGGNHPPPRRP
ncbi:MAG: membrane protein insertion efficiency factor YidD [Planctomycetota bacterium]|jgi:putative membrane protein insertion efficiency factor